MKLVILAKDVMFLILFGFLNILYKNFIFLNKYKVLIILTMTTVTLGVGVYVYGYFYSLSALDTTNAILNLFIDPVEYPVKDVKDSLQHYLLGGISISAKLTLFFAIIIFAIKSQLAFIHHWISVKKGKHVLVIGLDKNSRFFINSELEKGDYNIVVIESDETNPYIETYRNRAVSVICEEIDNVVNRIGIDSSKYIFVSTGDDKDNLYIALKIIEVANKNMKKKLLVHIGDRTLRSLYNDNSLLDSYTLDMRPFSYYKESARILFQKHDIDGDNIEIIESDKPFEIAVVGYSNLAIEVIAEAIKVAHLPNQNRLTINCIDQDVKRFKQRVDYEFSCIENLDYIQVKYIKLDYQDISFYRDSIWNEERLKHVIFCYDKTMININAVTKLKRVAYREQLDNSKRKVHMATYSDVQISKKLKENMNEDDASVFATANLVCDSRNLIDTDIEKLAKLIHYSYRLKKYDKLAIDTKEEIDDIQKKDITINDKRSSVAQALHINMKLKALNLRKKKSDKDIDIEELVKANNTIFNKRLDEERKQLKLTDEEVEKFDCKNPHFFPKEYNTIVEKILRSEHNRWNAMLTMMDNLYDEKAKEDPDRKIKKIHHLMKPFEKFEEDEKGNIIYDIYSLLYIPEYMASLKYELVEFK